MESINKKEMAHLLDALEAELKRLGFWDQEMPDVVKNLHSDMPFALDILEPWQWLQWVFIDKMRHLLAISASLPLGYAISPYIEEALKERDSGKLLTLLRAIDQLGNRGS